MSSKPELLNIKEASEWASQYLRRKVTPSNIAHSYELFGFARKDDLEIGRLSQGQSREAKESYVAGIADVLSNCKRFLAPDYNVFLAANDKLDLYPQITARAGMRIAEQFKRPVLNRTEKDNGLTPNRSFAS